MRHSLRSVGLKVEKVKLSRGRIQNFLMKCEIFTYEYIIKFMGAKLTRLNKLLTNLIKFYTFFSNLKGELSRTPKSILESSAEWGLTKAL